MAQKLSKLAFDGDVLVYKSGFSVERRFYILNGDVTVRYQSKKDALAACKTANLTEDKIEHVTEADSIELAKMNAMSIMKMAHKDLDAEHAVVYLSPLDVSKGKRFSAGKTAPYKGNRKGAKPVHYKELRAWMMTRFNTVVAPDELEADDLLGLSAQDHAICSIDKDLLMVPGVHYNLTNKKIVKASHPGALSLEKDKSGIKKLRGYGFAWFCAQMILGDMVDNIIGVKGMGSVAAYNYLKDCKTAKEYWAAIVKLYEQKLDMDRLEENKVLLWISQAESFEDILEKY